MASPQAFFFFMASVAAIGVVVPVVATIWFFNKLDCDTKAHDEEIRKIMSGER